MILCRGSLRIYLLLLTILLTSSVMAQSSLLAEGNRDPLLPGRIPRLALVIGIENYKNFDSVENAESDALAIARLFSDYGFSYVRTLLDAEADDKRKIFLAIDQLKTRLDSLSGSATIVFYFAGHGFQHDGEDFIVPRVVANPFRAADQSVADVQELLDESLAVANIASSLSLKRPAGVTIIFLDACRSDITNTLGDRSRVKKGFAKVKSQSTLISLATSQDSLATSQGRRKTYNSPYAAALVNVLFRRSEPFVPGQLGDIREYVCSETGSLDAGCRDDDQQITTSQNIEVAGKYFFFRNDYAAFQPESKMWSDALTSNSRACVERFLREFPDGYFTQQALGILRARAESSEKASARESNVCEEF